MIEEGQSPESARRLSFAEIIECLKASRFEIMAGVDSDEVSEFLSGWNRQSRQGKGSKRNRCKSSRPTIESFPQTSAIELSDAL
jgi:hypothetical protein